MILIDQRLRLTPAWLRANRDDVRLVGMPRCARCGKALRRGGFVDPFWPYHDLSRHARCARRNT